MSKVQVLMSTYNGEKYLRQQLDSILNQSYQNISILIRDDGSKDNTIAIIKTYVEQYPSIIKLLEGRNIGVIDSFFELIRNSCDDVEYYCFCDQDDIWFPNKIESAVKTLSELHRGFPALCFTSTYPTFDMLNTKKKWPNVRREPSFNNALVENIAVGATITFNRSLLQLVRVRMPKSNNIIMHDWWLYLIASSLGKIVYDKAPSILYRQHESNLVGADTSFLNKIKKKLIRFKNNKNKKYLFHQAQEFYSLYSDVLSETNKKQLKLFLLPRKGLKGRVAFLKQCELYRQSKSENLLFKLLVIIGYI